MKLTFLRIGLFRVFLATTFLIPTSALAVVDMFEGRLEIDGIILMRDHANPSEYRYVPPAPRLAEKPDGTYEFTFIRYDAEGKESGGMLHAVLEFSLPPRKIADLERELQKRRPGARIAGPVILVDPPAEDEIGMPESSGYSIKSATLGSGTSNTLLSGKAPVGTNGRIAVAAKLGAVDAALMWESFEGGAADLSIDISTYYLAHVPAYDARIEASMSAIYRHFSEFQNRQEGYTKEQIREVMDRMQRDKTIQFFESDTGSVFGVSDSRFAGVMETVQTKLTELMFDAEAGWSKPFEYVEEGDGETPGRSDDFNISFGSFLGFGSGGYTKDYSYIADDQYVLKDVTDIRVETFVLDLSKEAIIRTPLRTSGNLKSLYVVLNKDEKHFRYLNLDQDSLTQREELKMFLNGGYASAFPSVLDSVSVQIRHQVDGRDPIYSTVRLSGADIGDDKKLDFEPIELVRAGSEQQDWLDYDYRVTWALSGRPANIVVPSEDEWLSATDLVPSIAPPFARHPFYIQVFREAFDDDVRLVVVEIASFLDGERRILASKRFSEGDVSSFDAEIFADAGAPVLYRVVYFKGNDQVKTSFQEIGREIVVGGMPE